MGVNMAGNCIFDDDAVQDAARQEIIRRYYTALYEKQEGRLDEEQIYRFELLMNQANTSIDDRRVVSAALTRSEETDQMPAAALELPDGRIITGKTTSLLGASSAVLLNALKALAGIDHDEHCLLYTSRCV